MKKIKFENVDFKELSGTPLYMRNSSGYILTKENSVKGGEPIKMVRNLKETCVNLLANASEDGESGTKKLDKFMLAQKIQLSKDEIELKSEEITMIKDIVGKYEAPIIVGQVYQALGEL